MLGNARSEREKMLFGDANGFGEDLAQLSLAVDLAFNMVSRETGKSGSRYCNGSGNRK
jgi:hypothetical protein